MKKLLLKTGLLTALLFVVLSTYTGYSQTLFSENSDYTEGTLLTTKGWSAYCMPGVSPVTVSSPGLYFQGYAQSGIGNSIMLHANGENILHTFTAPELNTSGNIYISFMVSVNQAASGNFLSLANSSPSDKRARIFVNNTAPFNFGLSLGSANPLLTSETFLTGNTYLIVVKYTIREGSCNDDASMYVFSDAVPSEEPLTPSVGPLTDVSLTDICPSSVQLHQNNKAQAITVDGIRVGTSWQSAVTNDCYAPLFIDGYPSATAIKHDRFDFQVSLNEAGKVFYMAVPAGSVAPSATEVKAGAAYGEVIPVATGTIDVTAGTTVYSSTITGLTALTSYDIYAIAQDDEASPNVQSTPASLTVTTLRVPDASLSALMIDGTTIAGFSPSTLSYTMIYEPGTTAIPAVTFTLNDPEATAAITPATDLTGDDVARTALVVVTAYDGETKSTYSVSFDPVLILPDLTALRAIDHSEYERIYEVSGEVFVTATGHNVTKFMFIQDFSGSGMFINDIDNKIVTAYYVGDGIKSLRGSLKDYDGMLGFVVYRDPGERASAGTMMEKQTLSIPVFLTNFESYESELITIKGAAFAGADGTAMFTPANNYKISVDAEETVARPLIPGSDLAETIIPYMADVSGVATWVNSTAGVTPRNADDLLVYSSDATLSKIAYNRSVVQDFYADKMAYDVLLSQFATVVPKVSAVMSDHDATMSVIQATSLTGSVAERTATIKVVSHDKAFTNNYTVTFIKPAVTAKSEIADIFPVPATTEVTVKNIEGITLMEVFNSSGMKMQSVQCNDETEKTIYLNDYPAGFYFIKCTTAEEIFLKKFIVKQD